MREGQRSLCDQHVLVVKMNDSNVFLLNVKMEMKQRKNSKVQANSCYILVVYKTSIFIRLPCRMNSMTKHQVINPNRYFRINLRKSSYDWFNNGRRKKIFGFRSTSCISGKAAIHIYKWISSKWPRISWIVFLTKKPTEEYDKLLFAFKSLCWCCK